MNGITTTNITDHKSNLFLFFYFCLSFSPFLSLSRSFLLVCPLVYELTKRKKYLPVNLEKCNLVVWWKSIISNHR